MSHGISSVVVVAKMKTVHKCSTCGEESARWVGQCPGCNDWNTMVEMAPIATIGTGGAPARRAEPVSLASAAADPRASLRTGVEELDRVLGGGLTLGSVSLLGGEPGIGKSTLILQLCASIARQKGTCLIVTGEESVDQVGRRADRLGASLSNVLLIAESQVEVALATMDEVKPKLVIIDSIQTMVTGTANSAAGTVSQVRESAAAFTAYAKEHNVAMVLIGHVTKEGSLAGPRVLEHMVDTVLEFEGDRHSTLRFLRTVKHRFGATDEVGVLEMKAEGLQSVPDASAFFLDDRQDGVSGSAVVPVLHGRRPMLVEIQALTVENENSPRRYAQGLDVNRLAVVNAVLQKHAGIVLTKQDVYASVIGGLRVDDPGTDLAVALAVFSTHSGTPIPDKIVAIGELGLSGEVRKATHVQKRLAEAQRMGFTAAIVPFKTLEFPGIKLMKVKTVGDAIQEIDKIRGRAKKLKKKHDDAPVELRVMD
jgi:DNA repair protein RadA/Sms